MDSFDRNWRGLQLETLVDLSLTIGGVLSEEELVEELLQRAVGTLDAGSGFVATLHPGGQEAVVNLDGCASPPKRLRFSKRKTALSPFCPLPRQSKPGMKKKKKTSSACSTSLVRSVYIIIGLLGSFNEI